MVVGGRTKAVRGRAGQVQGERKAYTTLAHFSFPKQATRVILICNVSKLATDVSEKATQRLYSSTPLCCFPREYTCCTNVTNGAVGCHMQPHGGCMTSIAAVLTIMSPPAPHNSDNAHPSPAVCLCPRLLLQTHGDRFPSQHCSSSPHSSLSLLQRHLWTSRGPRPHTRSRPAQHQRQRLHLELFCECCRGPLGWTCARSEHQPSGSSCLGRGQEAQWQDRHAQVGNRQQEMFPTV